MTKNAWQWAVWRDDGTLVGIAIGMKAAIRLVEGKSANPVVVGCYVISPRVKGVTYLMQRYRGGIPESIPAWCWERAATVYGRKRVT